MLRKNTESEPSEVGNPGYSPNIWKRIREQNRREERESNPPHAPHIYEAPKAWLCRSLLILVTFWVFFHA